MESWITFDIWLGIVLSKEDCSIEMYRTLQRKKRMTYFRATLQKYPLHNTLLSRSFELIFVLSVFLFGTESLLSWKDKNKGARIQLLAGNEPGEYSTKAYWLSDKMSHVSISLLEALKV